MNKIKPIIVNSAGGDLCTVAQGLDIQIPDEIRENIKGKNLKFSGSFRPVKAGKVILDNKGSVREFLKNSQVSGEILKPIETAEEFLALIASAKKEGKKLPDTIVVRSETKGKMLCYYDGGLRLHDNSVLSEGAYIAAKVTRAKSVPTKKSASIKKSKKASKAA